MADRIYNVLFLCTGNSARSIMAESILSKDGAGHFRAFSAGIAIPRDGSFALTVLESFSYPTEGFRSKSWDVSQKSGSGKSTQAANLGVAVEGRARPPSHNAPSATQRQVVIAARPPRRRRA